MTVIKIPKLNNLEVELDFSELSDDGIYQAYYSEETEYTEEEVCEAVEEVVNEILKRAECEIEVQKEIEEQLRY